MLPDLTYWYIHGHVVGFDNWRKTSSGELLGRLPIDVDAEW